MDIPGFPDVTCGHAQVCLVMESELRGPGQVHIGLRVAPGEHGEGSAGELGGGETQKQHDSGLLEHIKSEAEKLGSQCSWGASLIQIFGRWMMPVLLCSAPMLVSFYSP